MPKTCWTPRKTPNLLRVTEVAKILKISTAQAYALAALGTIPSVRFGRSVRVPEAELMAWIKAHTQGGKSA